ncbi:hypothetical protein FOZ63_033208, partial [Perkinsus olseni]
MFSAAAAAAAAESFVAGVGEVEEAGRKPTAEYAAMLNAPMAFRGLAKSKDDFSGDKLVKEFGDEKIALSLSIEERSDKPTNKSWTNMQEYVEGDVKGYIKQLPVPQNLAQKFQAILDATFCRHRKDTLYMWVGRASTVTATGVHSDDEDNILVQLQGVKRVVLFPPDAGAAVYVNDKYDDGTRCCDADVYAQNWRGKWPKLAGVQMAALKVTLREGDVLYFPRNWYHDVRILPEDNIDRKSGGIDLSVSVNVFSTWWPRYMVEEYFQSDVVALCCWADVSTVRLLADLLPHEGDEETSIGNLMLSRPLTTTSARTPHQRYIKDNCYSLGCNDDLEEFQKFPSRGRIKNFQPHNTQLCVHGEGVDEKGHHLKADLHLGRIRGPAGLTAQYVIPMILRRAEEGDGGDVGSVGRILPSPLPSVGVYVNSADANLPTGVLKTSVSVRSKVDGVIAADITIRVRNGATTIPDLIFVRPFFGAEAKTPLEE